MKLKNLQKKEEGGDTKLVYFFPWPYYTCIGDSAMFCDFSSLSTLRNSGIQYSKKAAYWEWAIITWWEKHKHYRKYNFLIDKTVTLGASVP